MERRVLSSVAGGSGGVGGPGRVNALAPLSCVVDVHGYRAAAIALPSYRVRPETKLKLRRSTKLLG